MATGSKVGQQKGKDWDVVVPRIGHVDMEEENLAKVIAACKTACGAEHKYYKDYAVQIKAELDKEIGPSWHIVVGKLHFIFITFCILGTHFGSFVGFEHKHIALFWLEEKGFLCYKHG